MKTKKLLLFTVLDIVIIAIVISLFLNIDRRIAGLLGGALFFGQGLFILKTVVQWQNPSWYFTFYAALAHIFLATIPLVILRLTHWSLEFEEIQLGFITGPGFHKFSEFLYMGLIGSHLLDIAKIYWLKKKEARPSTSKG